MDDVQLVKAIWVIEHVGGVIYDRFAEKLDNPDIAGTFNRFAGHEHMHAKWYGEWLTARGQSVPTPDAYDALIVPGVRFWLAPQSLERKLQTFSTTERTAARHLAVLASKVQDPELKAIIERTIPYEHMHAEWYGKEGRRMLHPGEASTTALNLE